MAHYPSAMDRRTLLKTLGSFAAGAAFSKLGYQLWREHDGGNLLVVFSRSRPLRLLRITKLESRLPERRGEVFCNRGGAGIESGCRLRAGGRL